VRILIVSDELPYPLISGDRIRVYNLVRRIAEVHQVWLAILLKTPGEAGAVAHLQEFCEGVETATYKHRDSLAHVPGLLQYAFRGMPLEFKFSYSEELASKILDLTSTVNFDVIQIEHSYMTPYLDVLPVNGQSKCVLDIHNVASQQYERMFRVERGLTRKIRYWLYSRTMRRWEPRYAERVDRCLTMSEADRHLLIRANPRVRADVIPNGVDTHVHQPLPQEWISPPALIFVGTMNYVANSDAAIYFCQEILPNIRQMIGEVEMWIVGSKPPPELRQLDGNGVNVTGQVDDVMPYYSRSAVCVIPLRAGGGTRLKILEAMALGRPVVSTSIGCEGLDVVAGEHLLIADTAKEFAKKTVRLLTDRTLHRNITKNARQLVKTQYDWDAIAGQLMKVYREIQND
jgi:sugar transferase (PEP-CTERM/EpsH1 system associated)